MKKLTRQSDPISKFFLQNLHCHFDTSIAEDSHFLTAAKDSSRIGAGVTRTF